MRCRECLRDFPDELIQPLVTERGKRPMCPLYALRERNRAAGLPFDTPFHGTMARKMHEAALAHVKARKG